MRFLIKHHTRYEYNAPVYLEPQHFYFYPIPRNHLKLRDFQISVKPDTAGLTLRTDAEGNFYHQVWFANQLDNVEIDVEMKIETFDINPFDFLIENDLALDHTEALELYKKQIPLSSELKNWVDNLKNQVGDDALTFVSFLNKEIRANWGHTANYEKMLMPPDECFKKDNGSCRDLAWMMINMLRYQNLPARFVSGYAHNPELEEGHELHAWVEVWFNGGGWVGMDPSSGVLATHNHIPVCCSFNPGNTFPVQGTYRGNASSKLTTEVSIAVL